MINSFSKTSEIEIIPMLKKMGAKLIRKMPKEIVFSFKGIEVSIYLEREIEVYGVVSSSKSKQKVYLSEILLDYLKIENEGMYHLSERFSLELCLRKMGDLIALKIFPLISSGRIIEAMNLVMVVRKEGLRKYYEGLIEKDAEEAFMGKRYKEVISCYDKITELNDVQIKRLEISKRNIVKTSDLT